MPEPEEPLLNEYEVIITKLKTRVAELEKAQLELTLQKERDSSPETLNALEMLARGIVSDVNNTLSTIIDNLGLARLGLKSGTERGQVDELLAKAEKVAFLQTRQLTPQLLPITSDDGPRKEWTELNELLQKEVRFALRGSRVSTQFKLAPHLWPVEIDRGQIAQVLHNLVRNAIQAMPRGGRLWIEANNLNLKTEDRNGNDQNLAFLTHGEEENYVEVKVRDEGDGIEAEVLPLIFDPFFTTRQKSNGLGLAIVFSIISQHRGFVTATSQPGQGTTFSFYLPWFKNGPEN